jgi:hypothetical protein
VRERESKREREDIGTFTLFGNKGARFMNDKIFALIIWKVVYKYYLIES